MNNLNNTLQPVSLYRTDTTRIEIDTLQRVFYITKMHDLLQNIFHIFVIFTR